MMDANSDSHPWQWPVSPVIDATDTLGACMLCRRNISLENGVGQGYDEFNICGDCKFLVLEDLESPVESRRQRRTIRDRSTSYENLESFDDIFPRNAVDNMSQDQPNVSIRGDRAFNYDSAAMQSQRSSSLTTPNGSRRWIRVASDTESLELDSAYAGSESNFGFGGSRNFQSETDAGSFSAYGAESDFSVDGRLDTELFPQIGIASDFDSDTDIDPMHAGVPHQWDSDISEEDDDWETDNEASPAETNEESLISDHLFTRLSERNANITLRRTPEDAVNLRIMERREAYISNIFANLEESDLPPHAGNIEDYLEVAEFEAFLDRLAGSEISRQGAPPAAESFLRNLPRLVITEEHLQEQYDLTCAVCKDQMVIGTEVNQLPCSHLYHSHCIMPWLNVRNSCPLCRFELPTDDLEYEDKKQRSDIVVQVQQQLATDDILSHVTDDTESPPTDSSLSLQDAAPRAYADLNEFTRENRRGWLYIAAPIVGFVGVVLVFWLGNPQSSRRAMANSRNLQPQNQHLNIHSVVPPNLRGDNQRRWWSLF